MAREFATGANIVHIPDDASTGQEAILKMIIQYNYLGNPMREVLKYWAAHNIYRKIQAMIKEKIEAGPTNAPGNPANIAMNQTIAEIATLESQHTDNHPNLNKFVEADGKGAIWVIPFNALEAAFSRGLDSAGAIYVTVVLDFLAQNEKVESFITKLGARTRDTFLPLSKA
ncbi:hypothetical protein LQW54_004215 [Pestalotiopsis sp. IQ-011]